MSTEDKAKQVAAQCQVVAHLATALAGVHAHKSILFERGLAPDLVEMVGEHTARFMETLGDMLNGMDAITDDDAWTDPVFEAAHRLWPATPAPPSIDAGLSIRLQRAKDALDAMDAQVTDAEIVQGLLIWDTTKGDDESMRAVLIDFLTTRIAERRP